MSSAIAKLKSELLLKHALIDAENLKSSPGVATGWSELDSFVASGGFPCGELCILESLEGFGALTLWLQTAARLTQGGGRAAWMNSETGFALHAPTAFQRGIDLQKLFLVDINSSQKRHWALREILASQLFSLVGCDLGDETLPLRECRSLLMHARRSGAAVVLFQRREARSGVRALASLVLKFESQGIEVVRAARRPVPQNLDRRNQHVDFITGPRNTSDTSGVLENRAHARHFPRN